MCFHLHLADVSKNEKTLPRLCWYIIQNRETKENSVHFIMNLKCYGYEPNVKPVFMLGSNAGNVVENTEDVPKEDSHYKTMMMPLERKTKDSQMIK